MTDEQHRPKTLDERLKALVESVELLASLHRENEERMRRQDAQIKRSQRAMLEAMRAYLTEIGGDGEGEDEDGR